MEEIKNVLIRNLSESEVQLINQAKEESNENTASKAVMSVLEKYFSLKERYRNLDEEHYCLSADMSAVMHALKRKSEAENVIERLNQKYHSEV